MPIRTVKRSRGFTPNLYFDVSLETKKKFGMKRGDAIRCTLKRVADSEGRVIKNVNREVECRILKRDGRFYLPSQLVQELNLFGGEYYELILRKQMKADGEEVEIYPGEVVEKDIGVEIKQS